MALKFVEKVNVPGSLPEIFKEKRFRSYVDMANFADQHSLPDGDYFIYNTAGGNLWTAMRELKRRGSRFWVAGRGNI